VIKKNLDKLYSEEISPATSPEYAEYVHLNLKKIKEFRKNFQIPVIGVAGADGKTTTKGMLSAILGQRGKILQTPLDCDSASIVSSTLLRLNNDYSYCLIEMGIFNQEQFKLAVEMSQPDIGIVTNIGEAHLAKLGDKYLIANANVELIRQLKADGYAVLNIDDELVSEMDTFAGTQRILKFGFNHAAHFHAAEIKYLGPDGMMFLVNNYYKFHLPIYSSTSVSNALAAIAAARILNFEFDEIQNGLKNHFKMIPGRGNFIELGDVFILDHTYNATINSVTKACESLVQFKNFSKNLISVRKKQKFYTGPVQMKANNGLLIVDDFGRQRISPEEMLNRWVVPLDRRVDFLTLAGGKKIEIPFDLLVVFATNLDPAKLVDEAFLRRIQTKIKIGYVTSNQFREIFRRACMQLKLTYKAAKADDLLQIIQEEYQEPLRACYPRDIIQQIVAEARYSQKEPRVNRGTLAAACRNYFLAP